MYIQSKIILSQNPSLDEGNLLNLLDVESPNTTRFYLFRKLENKNSIGIGEVRDIFEINSARDEFLRISVIFNADKLTPEAQNSLLKVVEEPRVNSLIVFVTNNLNRILETIRSRCLVIYDEKETNASSIESAEEYIKSNFLEREKITKLIIDSKNPREQLDRLIESVVSYLSDYPEALGSSEGLEILINSKKANSMNVNLKSILDNLNINL